MDAGSLACREGITVKQYCAKNPQTSGCPEYVPGPSLGGIPMLPDDCVDPGGSDPCGEEEDQLCGGVPCTDDEKEDSYLTDIRDTEDDIGYKCDGSDVCDEPWDYNNGSDGEGNSGIVIDDRVLDTQTSEDEDEEEGKIDPKDEIGREPEPEPDPEPEPEPESEPEEEEDNEEEEEEQVNDSN
jgi:hypothetical protein